MDCQLFCNIKEQKIAVQQVQLVAIRIYSTQIKTVISKMKLKRRSLIFLSIQIYSVDKK